MSKLLFVEGSPRGERSKSSQIAHSFLEAYRASHPDDEIEHIHLWKTSLPTFDGDMLEAKYAILHGQEPTPQQAEAWKTVTDMIEAFQSADKYLFSVPMWNFSVPYKVKHYFDIIIQPGLTFSFSPDEGYKGLVDGKATIVYARGGAYAEGTGAEAYDLQTKTFSGLLSFIGITEQIPLLVEPTLAPPDNVQEMVETAQAKAVEIAADF